MTPAEALRGRVVTFVLLAVIALSAGLYALVGALLWAKGTDAVPDALWLAAGTAAGTLFGWLNNSKGQDTPVPVEVVSPDLEPVPFDDRVPPA